jgi:hypothetical protein
VREVNGLPLARHPEIVVAVRAPSAVDIAETSLGLNPATIAVTMTNTGAAAVRLGEVHLGFVVKRGDVELSCAPQAVDRANDADTLAPGESFTATGNLGCWTPIAGEYVARVFVAFDADGEGVAPGDLAGEIHFAIVDSSRRAAREAPTHPGLFALAGGAIRTPPVADVDAAERGYQVAVVVMNASARNITFPAARVSLRVYAAGATTPCTGEATAIRLPQLGSGQVQVLHVPVTCLRDRLGDYVVVVHAAFEGEAEEAGFDIGRVPVRVTRDLDVLIPRR